MATAKSGVIAGGASASKGISSSSLTGADLTNCSMVAENTRAL
jgi:hypothetical protein